MDLPDWAPGVAAIAAVVVALVSALISWRSQRAAVRSARASENSAKSAARSADAAERTATTAEDALALAREVRWGWAQMRGAMFQLTNLGRDTAYDVEVHHPLVQPRSPATFDEFEGGRVAQVRVLLADGARQHDVEITWASHPGGPIQRQRRVL